MPKPPYAPLDDPLLNDAFDFSRYPVFKTAHTTPHSSFKSRRRGRGRSLFTVYSNGSPLRTKPHKPRRNVSEPLLSFSTNRARESLFTAISSARTVGDITSLSPKDDTPVAICHSQSATAITDTARCAIVQDFYDRSGVIGSEPSEHKDEDSFYSMESANQDAHPLLLSMPMVPEIKLERKATVKKLDRPQSGVVLNQDFLSPRIRDIRTPLRLSSRRYGVLAQPSQPAIRGRALSKFELGGFLSQAVRRFGSSTGLSDRMQNGAPAGCAHLTSVPILKPPCTLDDEKEPFLKRGIDDLLQSEVLLSTMEGAGPYPNLHSDELESVVNESPGSYPTSPKYSTRGLRRSSLCHSLSFNVILQAVSDGCASLDVLLRKIKSKSREDRSYEPIPNERDPTSKWAVKDGEIIIKVFVPSTDDIWKFRVPQDIDLASFSSRVVAKLGFFVTFSGSLWDEPKYHFTTDEQFKSWVKGRVRFRRNLPLVAHVPAPPPLMKLSVDRDGCEVWCYA